MNVVTDYGEQGRVGHCRRGLLRFHQPELINARQIVVVSRLKTARHRIEWSKFYLVSTCQIVAQCKDQQMKQPQDSGASKNTGQETAMHEMHEENHYQ